MGSGYSRPLSRDGRTSVCMAEMGGEPGVLDDAGLRLERRGAVPMGPSRVDRPGWTWGSRRVFFREAGAAEAWAHCADKGALRLLAEHS